MSNVILSENKLSQLAPGQAVDVSEPRIFDSQYIHGFLGVIIDVNDDYSKALVRDIFGNQWVIRTTEICYIHRF